MRKPPSPTCAFVTFLTFGAVPPMPGQDAPGRYEASWESIKKHPVPEWFHDAKLGIFPVWGVYSVPGWAPPTGELGKVDFSVWFKRNPYAEWYWNSIKIKDSLTWKHHAEKYGEKFEYHDFIPTFNREARRWNPEQWADLFREAGGKYVVLTTKFHDGFPLWPSQVRNPRKPVDQVGAGRDYVGDLTNAVRARGMKMGLYYSGGLDWSFNETPIIRLQDVWDTVPQTEEYARYADAHWRELIDRYRTDVLWNDISYPKAGKLAELFSYYYNKIPEGLINDRFGVEFSDFTTPEYATYDRITPKKWEATRGLGFSFGYNQVEGPEHVLSEDKLVDILADIVSKNGNLLLAVGPRGDGSIPELQVERLRALGKWLRQNGEAIYGTRPWVTAEGLTSDGGGVRFTRKGNAVYAILLDRPKGRSVLIEGLNAADASTIQLLGAGDLKWSQKGRDLEVELPSALPGDHAWALKITPRPWRLVNE